MELKLQPKNSRTCWAHCISMVTEVPVKEILEMAGHKHGARFKEIAAIMNKLGYTKASRKYRPFFYQKELPPVCFLCLNWKSRGAHLVVYNNGQIYCPGKGIYDYNLKNIDKQEVGAKFYMQIGEKA